MNLDLIRRFPGWVLDLTQHPDDYTTIMSNDYDSFLSCRYLRYVLGVPIGGYYDFSSGIFLTDKAMTEQRTPILMDVACIMNGVCAFDNHCLLSNNHMLANPNSLLSCADRCIYNKKYSGSTLLFLYALLNDREINGFEKKTLMVIDGFYRGFFNDDGAYRDVNERWLDRLGLRDVLQETIDSHDREDYERFAREQGFDKKFKRSSDDFCLYEFSDSESTLSALLFDDKKLSFPNQVLSVKQSYCTFSEMVQGYLNGKKTQPGKGLFSAAQTSFGKFIYSVVLNNSDWWCHYAREINNVA